MVWFDSAAEAVADSKANNRPFLAFITDDSIESVNFQEIIHSKDVESLIADTSCIKINILSGDFKDFSCEFPVAKKTQICIIDNNEMNIVEKSDNADFVYSKIADILNKKIADSIKQMEEIKDGGDKHWDDNVRVKFNYENTFIWISNFIKTVPLNELRSHVAQEINKDKKEFSLTVRFPRKSLSFEHDQLPLNDLGMYPSCIIDVELIQQEIEKPSTTSYIYSAYNYFYNFVATLISTIVYFLPFQKTSTQTINVEVKDATFLSSNKKNRKFVNKSDLPDDDDELRKTDNGNNTMQM